MKSLSAILIASSLALAACTATPAALATATAQATDLPTAVPVLATPTHIAVDLPPAQRAAIAQVAQSLNVAIGQVRIVSTEATMWPNGCLGVQRLGVMCTQNEVPGFRIVVSANGKQYEVHTNQDGSVIAPEQALEAPGPAQQVAIKQLAANLGVSDSDVKLISTAVVEWPDSCLGVAQQGVLCSQIVTPGYLFVLEVAGRQYEYHTSQDASRIMPGSLALDWKQAGGVGGLCQQLTVYLSGEIYGQNCQAGGDGRMGLLTAAQHNELNAWVDKFGTTSVDLSDPKGMADAMSRAATLNGVGQQKPGSSDRRAIFEFGRTLYVALYH